MLATIYMFVNTLQVSTFYSPFVLHKHDRLSWGVREMKFTWSGAEKDCQHHNKHLPDHSRSEWAGFDFDTLILLVVVSIIVSRVWERVRDWLIGLTKVPHWQPPHSSLLTALSLTDWSLGAGGFGPAFRPAYSRHRPLESHRQFTH